MERKYNPFSEETFLPPEDALLPPETAPVPADEFAGKSNPAPKEEGSSHSRLKKMILMPAVATLAAVSVLFSSFGYDPLGLDIFNGSSSSSSPFSPPATASLTIPPVPGGAPAGIINETLHVTYRPTGENFTASTSGDAGLDEIVTWVKGKGGSKETVRYVRSTLVRTGYKLSDDALFVGDTDDIDNIYLLRGTLTYTYRRDVYYEAYKAGDTVIPEGGGASFPTLPNRAPDFAGDYAWSGSGSEEYVRLIPSGGTSYAYLQAGSVWVGMGAAETAVPGATYDKATNTLTLENFSAAVLDVNLMGNGFTIRLIGDNTLDQLTVWGAGYAGSVLLTGTGTLTVNQNGAAPDGVGIRLNAEAATSPLNTYPAWGTIRAWGVFFSVGRIQLPIIDLSSWADEG